MGIPDRGNKVSKKYALHGIYAGGCKLYVPTSFPAEILNLIVDADGVPAIANSWVSARGVNQNPATEIYSLIFDPRQTKDSAVAAIEAALERHYMLAEVGKRVTGGLVDSREMLVSGSATYLVPQVNPALDRIQKEVADEVTINTEAFLRP